MPQKNLPIFVGRRRLFFPVFEPLVLNQGVGVVVVDAFQVFGFDLIPSDALVLLQAADDVSDKVFHEDGVFVGGFGDVLFVGPLEKRVEAAAGRGFHNFDEASNPDGLP